MSKSLRRVTQHAQNMGLTIAIKTTEVPAKTAAQAASLVDCTCDQIGKSIVFKGQNSDRCVLFLTAGGRQVDKDKAAQLAGEPLSMADAQTVRGQTGFAIGGVSPLGHLTPIPIFMDPRLLDFDQIWVAAGTPNSLFCVEPSSLCDAIGATLGDFTQ